MYKYNSMILIAVAMGLHTSQLESEWHWLWVLAIWIIKLNFQLWVISQSDCRFNNHISNKIQSFVSSTPRVC